MTSTRKTSPSPFFSRKLWWLVVVVCLIVSPLVIWASLRPSLKHSVLKLPGLSNLYVRYSKWRYDWRSPADMGDGNSASQIIIEGPMGIGEDRLGNLYVCDRDARLVWKIETSGKATVIAGTGMITGPSGIPAVPTPARAVDLASPEGLALDGDGNILFADSDNHSILKIDPAGYLTRIAGTGSKGYNGDSRAAITGQLTTPHDVRLDSRGNVYIADVFNHRIRKIDRNGILTTVAGTGVAGYSGDGGPAINAQLNTPYGILLDRNDNLLIADSENHMIRKVGSDGIIRQFAGSGERGFEGDNGPALEAKLDSPQSLAIDSEDRIYINDEHNHAIRIVETDGTLHTLIGSKGPGFSGDGGPAALAQIADPENIWISQDGSILITVRDNSRVRRVTREGVISTFAGRGPTTKHEYASPILLPPVDP